MQIIYYSAPALVWSGLNLVQITESYLYLTYFESDYVLVYLSRSREVLLNRKHPLSAPALPISFKRVNMSFRSKLYNLFSRYRIVKLHKN
jgi:hypothetical protein